MRDYGQMLNLLKVLEIMADSKGLHRVHALVYEAVEEIHRLKHDELRGIEKTLDLGKIGLWLDEFDEKRRKVKLSK